MIMNMEYNMLNEWYLLSRTEHKAGEYSPLHYHHSYEIFFMLSGTTEMLVDGRIIELSPNDVVLLRPDCLHKNNGGTKHERYAVHFTDKYLLNYFTPCAAEMLTAGFDNEKRSIKKDAFFRIVNILKTMEREPETAFFHLGGIMTCLRDKNNLSTVQKNIHRQPTENILAFINSHYNSVESLDDIASAVHISKQYLCSVFKKDTGVTVTEYLNGVRINTACDMLSSSDMSVTDIAAGCGYNSSVYFGKVFKCIVHMTPKEYRRYIRNL